ncbi:GNAT family N-acetyltransferase [Ulvibacterium marinum]|uniref:GNAT family N-acetyltransferase n=2 Tax=Ulvibacterium marinum TaxID=2419782 RepID=A0A3B0C6Y2_9FLAO|nr:GNAT family N-acetyltransferase [Ulvibacterium marinum]
MALKEGKRKPKFMDIAITALTRELFDVYCAIGIKSYRQFYLHLWEDEDPAPYINTSFTQSILGQELAHPNHEHFIIYQGASPVGIFKVLLHSKIAPYSSKEAFLLEKLYLLREYSGKGIGTEVLNFAENKAKELKKEILWLDTMKKGPALNFYLKNGFKILREGVLDLPNVLENERQMLILYKTV